MKRTLKWLATALLVLAVAVALWLRHNEDELPDSSQAQPTPVTAETLARGEYLTRAGNCMHCHTRRGGEPYAGGRSIDTPFGTVYSSNLTPDSASGLGTWSAQDFWRAMHHGQAKDGRWLLPVFPYANYTRVNRADSDAIFAYLRAQPAVAQANRAQALRWPYNSQWALGVWRALYFRSAGFKPDATKPESWNRGAYLVQGLGHCSACHNQRNALGASADALALSGGVIPQQGWYAPSLLSRSEAGVQDWDTADIAHLLHGGNSPQAGVSGPMAEVVLHSTQYLSSVDVAAMAQYLKDLPAAPLAAAQTKLAPEPGTVATGERLYGQHCANCHGKQGEGVNGAYPALAGNRAVTLAVPMNLVQVVLNGGFAPSTADNPRPYGMPPFALALSDADIAAVLTYVRSAWGNQAGAVEASEVDRLRKHTAR